MRNFSEAFSKRDFRRELHKTRKAESTKRREVNQSASRLLVDSAFWRAWSVSCLQSCSLNELIASLGS
jgi:hypothetical protein